MRVSDSLLGGALVVFAIALLAYSQTFSDIPGQQYGAALFPSLVAVGFAGCGVGLMVQGHRARMPLVSRSEWSRGARALPAVFAAILAIAIYIAVSDWIGFLPVMFALLLLLLALFRVRWWMAIATALVTTLVTYTVFVDLLLVPLPQGLMPRLPW